MLVARNDTEMFASEDPM